MRPSIRPPAALLALPLALGACVNAYPQRAPGPLIVPSVDAPRPADPLAGPPPAVPLPAEGAPPATLTHVVVQRDSDPVWVRLPGERDDYDVPFYEKRERVPAGTLVRTGAGGRAECLWSPDESIVALFDEGRVTLGEPARDEPMARFHSVSRALLMLTPEDRVELVGGPVLAGDSLSPTGPILLEAQKGSILRVTNQSKLLAHVHYREERLELGPGESIDLPILPSGAGPREQATEPQRFELLGLPVSVQGRVERQEDGGGLRLTALEPARITALGVEARLAAQETALFSGLSAPAERDSAEP